MKTNQKERTKFKRLDIQGGIDLLEADYQGQHFSKHTHDGYAFGVITKGELDFSYLNRSWQAHPGAINLVVPGEVHDGHGKSGVGWSYKMLYLPANTLKEINHHRSGQDKLPWFSSGVVEHPQLAQELLQLHLQLNYTDMDLLQQESLLTDWLTSFIEQYGAEQPKEQLMGAEQVHIKLCLDYLHEYYQGQISLHTLSQLTNLSPYYLLRSFKNSVGVPPHLYQQQLRISRAKTLLTEGKSLADIAVELGYTDQSHFSKQFKQIVGLTPGIFASIVANSSKR